MIRYGTISNFDDNSGRARVKYDDDGTVSHEMVVISPSTNAAKHMVSLTVGQRVAVVCDEDDVDGIVVGGYYSAKDSKPTVPSGGAVIEVGGTTIKYDSSGNVEISKGAVKMTIQADGVSIENGGDSLKSVLSDLITQINLMTHTVTAVGSPTGPPLNAAAFSSISTRIQNLLG